MSPQERAVERLTRADRIHFAAVARERAAQAKRVAAVEQARSVGVTYRAIADALGITIEAVTKMLVKARRDQEALDGPQPES